MSADNPLFYSLGVGDTGADLVRAEPAEEAQRVVEMDIDIARAVLQAIVETNETSFTDVPIDQIAGYSPDQVRLAVRAVAKSIMDEHDAEIGDGVSGVKKITLCGKATLVLGDADVYLYLVEPAVHSIEYQFATPEPGSIKGKQTRFVDGRRDKLASSFFNKDTKLVNFQHMIRGLRWMSANILNWNNPNVILPEQLDNMGLPKPPQGELSR